MTPVGVGIDVGGTKIAGAIVGAGGEVYDMEILPTPCHGDHDNSAEVTLALIDRLLQSAAARKMAVKRVGVGVPEYVTPDGRISSGLVLPSLRELPATTASGTPIVFDSDVRCAARAESLLGHGKGLPSFVFVIIGTGISSTFVVGGHPWAGQRGEAIALGELPVNLTLAMRPAAPLTVEEQASGRAIDATLKAAARGDGPCGSGTGDKTEILRRAGEIVATALCSVVHLLDPAALILGGGLGTSGRPFLDALSHGYARLTSGRPDPPPLLQAQLGPQAGVIGAGMLN